MGSQHLACKTFMALLSPSLKLLCSRWCSCNEVYTSECCLLIDSCARPCISLQCHALTSHAVQTLQSCTDVQRPEIGGIATLERSKLVAHLGVALAILVSFFVLMPVSFISRDTSACVKMERVANETNRGLRRERHQQGASLHHSCEEHVCFIPAKDVGNLHPPDGV